MTIFEQFLFVYFISASALAGLAVLWRNWLEDHPRWKEWLHGNLGIVARAMTCGSCFTFWITLAFVLVFDPFRFSFIAVPPFAVLPWPISYFLQWMSLGYGAVLLRFFYVLIQEAVSILVHRFRGHIH